MTRTNREMVQIFFSIFSPEFSYLNLSLERFFAQCSPLKFVPAIFFFSFFNFCLMKCSQEMGFFPFGVLGVQQSPESQTADKERGERAKRERGSESVDSKKWLTRRAAM